MVPFRVFIGPLHPKPVTGQELYLTVSYSKPALSVYCPKMYTYCDFTSNSRHGKMSHDAKRHTRSSYYGANGCILFFATLKLSMVSRKKKVKMPKNVQIYLPKSGVVNLRSSISVLVFGSCPSVPTDRGSFRTGPKSSLQVLVR